MEHDTTKSGNLGAFIIEHAQALGAHSRATVLPPLAGVWSYSQTSDITGRKVDITLAGDHLSELEPFLDAAFGRSLTTPVRGGKIGFALAIRGCDGVAFQSVRERDEDGVYLTKLQIHAPPESWPPPNKSPEPTADVALGLRLCVSARHDLYRLRLSFFR
jgi:hypothetical protein